MKRNGEFESLDHAHRLVQELKRRRRKGWESRNLSADSIAEHAFGSVFLAWIIAQLEGVDKTHVLEMAIVHELVMAVFDDITPSSISYSTKNELEEVAKHKIAQALPLPVRDRYMRLFAEYQDQESPEAKVARDAAKLETLMQGDAFECNTGRADILDEYLNTYETIISTGNGNRIFDHIRERHLSRKRVETMSSQGQSPT